MMHLIAERRRRAVRVTLACVGAAFALAAAPSRAQQVFFGPIPDQVTPTGFLVNPDFPRLFDLPSRWPGALGKLTAFMYRTRYVQQASDAELRRQFTFLAGQGVGVALVVGVVPSIDGCGQGLEGMVYGPNVNVSLAARMKTLGADVRYLIADEPLTFGHYSMLPGACRYPIPDLAARFGAEVARIRTVFPEIQVIDDEAATRLQVAAEVEQWITALRAALGPGVRLTLGLDVQWQVPWTDWARQFVPLLQRLHQPYGLLVHGTGQDQGDTEWLAAAEGYARAWESLIPARPRFVFIQSWNAYPTHVLPETDPTAMTSLIGAYCAGTRFRLACNGRH